MENFIIAKWSCILPVSICVKCFDRFKEFQNIRWNAIACTSINYLKYINRWQELNLFIENLAYWTIFKINVLIWKLKKEKSSFVSSKKKAFICIFRSLEWEYFPANSISPFCLLPKLTFGASNFYQLHTSSLKKCAFHD